MKRRRSPLPWLLAVAVILVAAWFWVAPHRSYDRFIRAVAFGSEAELAETVDFPLVRVQLKEDLARALERRSKSRIGAAVAATILDQAVDAALTPAGLANLITAFGTHTPAPGAADTLAAGTEVSFRYRSLSRVDVHVWAKGEDRAQAGILTFSRTGSRWRLSRVWSERLLGAEEGI